MKRLVVVLVALILSSSPLLADRIVKVEAISTDTTTFRENRIKLNMSELAAQLVPFQSVVDLSAYALLAGDADGQTIQGRTGENAAHVDIGEAQINRASLIGGGVTHGFINADEVGVYAESPDGLSSIDLYDTGLDLKTSGDLSAWGETSTISGVTSSPTTIQGAKISFHSQQTPPTNANDTCELGDTIDTATFHYYCAAPDTWVRVAMATWP